MINDTYKNQKIIYLKRKRINEGYKGPTNNAQCRHIEQILIHPSQANHNYMQCQNLSQRPKSINVTSFRSYRKKSRNRKKPAPTAARFNFTSPVSLHLISSSPEVRSLIVSVPTSGDIA